MLSDRVIRVHYYLSVLACKRATTLDAEVQFTIDSLNNFVCINLNILFQEYSSTPSAR